MATVFISYSRQNIEFARKLHAGLSAIEGDANIWIDWEGIASAAQDFIAEIYAGIEGSDTFLLIITPASLKSEICNLELAHAILHNKRIVPVIHQEVLDTDKRLSGDIIREWFNADWEDRARSNWQTLQHINWLFFRESDDFDFAFNNLTKTINTDLEHLKFHTRLTVRAVEWQRESQKVEFLLRGDDLKEAETWLAQSQGKNPHPTELHTQYILAGVKQREEEELARHEQSERERQRQRDLLQARMGIALAMALIIMLGIISLASQRNTNADTAREFELQVATAERRADVAHSLALIANAQLIASDNLELALVFALEANRISNPPEIVPEILTTLAAPETDVSNLMEWVCDTYTIPTFTPDERATYFITSDEFVCGE